MRSSERAGNQPTNGYGAYVGEPSAKRLALPLSWTEDRPGRPDESRCPPCGLRGIVHCAVTILARRSHSFRSVPKLRNR